VAEEKKMKTKLLVVLGVLVLSAWTMINPVMAVDAQSTITANISSVISIEVTGAGITAWPLFVGTNTNTTDVKLHVNCNNPPWLVTAVDALDPAGGNPKNTTTRGKMAQSTSSGAYVGDYNLTTTMGVAGADITNASFVGTAGSLSTSGVPLNIYQGNPGFIGAGNFGDMPITITQVRLYTDPALPSGDLYKIVVTFTASIL
jgi:hypothetical protein